MTTSGTFSENPALSHFAYFDTKAGFLTVWGIGDPPQKDFRTNEI